jgi:glycosyltransferase involved in cell wall biosynthesis
MKLSSLSILIPSYNCDSTLFDVITSANKIGKIVAKTYEIIVLNDASTDSSKTILSRLSKTIPRLRIITHTTNQGYGRTIKELYFAGKNEWLFSLPADNQFDAKELLKLVPSTTSNDLILGWRKIRNDSRRRLIQSRVYHILLRLLYGLKLHDVNTIRLMRRTLLKKISLTSDSAFVDAQLAIESQKHGVRIIEIPIIHKARIDTGATGGSLSRTILPTIRDMAS